MSKEPVIETDRLILRSITLNDAKDCFGWASDKRVNQFMPNPIMTDIRQTIQWIQSTLTDETEWHWAFVLKETNQVIGSGSIGPHAQMKGYWNIGYNLHYDYWHKGYCTEAMKAIMDFAHKKLGIKKFCADHAVDNPRSGKVLEKCGLKFDHYGEYSKFDGSQIFQAKYYKMELE